MSFLRNIFRFIVRTFAFVRKEVVEIIRQPRLLLTLVAGPFLILLLVGIGYRNDPRALRTMFVAQTGSEMEKQIDQYGDKFGPSLIYAGMTADQKQALDRLRAGEIDVVAVAPNDPLASIRNNKQAQFTLYHNEMDPLQSAYVNYFGITMINEVNNLVLQQAAVQGQKESVSIQKTVRDMQGNATTAREALERADVAQARSQRRELDRNLSVAEAAAGASLLLLSEVEPQDANGGTFTAREMRAILTDLRGDVNATQSIEQDKSDYSAEIDRLRKAEDRLTQLDAGMSEFQKIEPYVLVRPFASQAVSVSPTEPTVTDYFAPAVIVLLLQHLAVTFAALSLVKERQSGAIELFRASPLNAFEALLGKYISYLLFSGFVGTILTLLVIWVLRVPMLGNWYQYAIVVSGLLFASLSIGFFLSLIAKTDSQAVQFSMLVLLSSVFFAGVFLSLQSILYPVNLISWGIPATYGVALLQNIMLRGALPSPLWIAGLLAIGGLLFLVNLVLLHRAMARQ
jgi:ABC-2 type transport system permease protein